MLSIYTNSNNPLELEFWKGVYKRFSDKKDGPSAVLASLIRGLASRGISYELNPLSVTGETILVLSGPAALRNAVELKRSGKIKKLVAGPNVVVYPSAHDGIMQDDAIDKILIPSKWVADLWKREAPASSAKIEIWPSGVSESKASTRKGPPVIYNKMKDDALLVQVTDVLKPPFRSFTYGRFEQSDYLSALLVAPYMIYLSRSESQGLALQEAWAHDVPTLVNHSTHWEAGGSSWDSPQINCPYLTPELGAVFTDPAEIPIMVKELGKLSPKRYCDKHLSDRASVEQLLNLIG